MICGVESSELRLRLHRLRASKTETRGPASRETRLLGKNAGDSEASTSRAEAFGHGVGQGSGFSR